MIILFSSFSAVIYSNKVETTVFAADKASFSVGNAYEEAGNTVQIPIELTDNPGITAFRFTIEYDAAILKLTNVVFGEASKGFNTGTSQNYESPYSVSGYNSMKDIDNNGELILLTFEINKNADIDKYAIYISYDSDDVFNINGESINFSTQNGYVEVVSCKHSGGEFEYIKEESCVESGIMIKKCSKCGEEYERKVMEPTGHIFGAYQTDNAALCIQTGNKYRVCSVCNYREDEIIPALGHTYSDVFIIDKLSSCTVKGEKSRHCTRCGDRTQITAIPESGHNFGEWTIAQTGDSKDSGIRDRVCRTCGFQERISVMLSKTTYIYNGKAKKPLVTVSDSGGGKISSDNYDVLYSKGRIKAGKYSVDVIFKNKYSGTVHRCFTIMPKGTAFSHIAARPKGLYVKWKKRANVTGYKIQYSVDRKFKSAKTITVSKKTFAKKVSKLKSKKKYYIRIQTYTKSGGTRYNSSWSAVKTVTTE